MGGPAMSPESKARLATLCNAPDSDMQLRKQSLRLWSASEADGDVAILCGFEPDDPIYNVALFSRLVRRDRTAIPALLERLKTETADYWWQAGRYIWSDAITDALDGAL